MPDDDDDDFDYDEFVANEFGDPRATTGYPAWVRWTAAAILALIAWVFIASLRR